MFKGQGGAQQALARGGGRADGAGPQAGLHFVEGSCCSEAWPRFLGETEHLLVPHRCLTLWAITVRGDVGVSHVLSFLISHPSSFFIFKALHPTCGLNSRPQDQESHAPLTEPASAPQPSSLFKVA